MNKYVQRIFALLLAFVMTLSPSVTAYAGTVQINKIVKKQYTGRLPVYLLDKGDVSYLEVLVKGDQLYVSASSFAKRFGYLCGREDQEVQFLSESIETGENLGWGYISGFRYNSNKVWVSDGYDVHYYKAPYKCIKNEQGEWIPLQFALKIMGREMVINSGYAVVSKAHESLETIVNNVAQTELRSMQVSFAVDQDLTEESAEGESVLLMHVLGTNTKEKWLLEHAGNRLSHSGIPMNSEGIGELATYLVSNLSMESTAYYEAYYELLQLYLEQGFLSDVDAFASTLSESNLKGSSSYGKGMEIVEDSARDFLENNSKTLWYNQAFDKAYEAFTGYSPLRGKWTGETQYDEFIILSHYYTGDPSEGLLTSIDFYGSFLPDGISYGIADFYVYAHYMTTIFSENSYSGEIFQRYFKKNKAGTGNTELRSEVEARIADYGAYQSEVLLEAEKQIFSIDQDDLVDNGLEYLEDKSIILKFIIKLYQFERDYKNYISDMNEIAKKDLSKSSSNYLVAKSFANEIRQYALQEKDPDFAYIFYRTDLVSNLYLQKALGNGNIYRHLAQEDVEQLRVAVSKLMEYESTQLVQLQTGISYGLTEADNAKYNAAYEDEKYIALVELNSGAMGNSNGNINNCGFVATSGEYRYYVDAEDNYAIYRKALDQKGEKEKLGNGWAHWLNVYEKDGEEALIYVNADLDICSYNGKTGKSSVLAKGSYSGVMVAYGYVFAKKGGDLYRMEIQGFDALGAEEKILSQVGPCVCYEEDAIYYCDKSGKVYQADLNGEDRREMGFRSKSFDVYNGFLFYANEDDGNAIHAYNTLSKRSNKICSTGKAYGLNYQSGSLYFKVDDGMNSSMVYSVIPYVDKTITRVYSWHGPDEDFSVKNEDGKVASGRDPRRLFNVSGGRIWNEGYLWILSDYPVIGVNGKSIFGYICYKISSLLNKS